MKSFYIILANIFVSGVLTASLATSHAQEKERLLASQKTQNEAQETRARDCAMKAARVANEVNPRFYTESTTERVYKECLNN